MTRLWMEANPRHRFRSEDTHKPIRQRVGGWEIHRRTKPPVTWVADLEETVTLASEDAPEDAGTSTRDQIHESRCFIGGILARLPEALAIHETDLRHVQAVLEVQHSENPQFSYIAEAELHDPIDWRLINSNQREIDVRTALAEDGSPLSLFTCSLTPQTILEDQDEEILHD